MPKLIILDGPRGGDEVRLASSIQIGRSNECGLTLPDEGISKAHAQVELRGEEHLLVDLGSLNGTYVNRRRVRERILQHRDEIRVGSTRILFIDPRQARAQAIGLEISYEGDGTEVLEAGTTQVFRLPELQEPDEFGQFMAEYEKLHQAFQVGGELTGILEAEELGLRALEKLFEILPADRGVVFRSSARTSQLKPLAYLDDSPGARTGSIPEVCGEIIRHVAAKKTAVVVRDLAQDPRFGKIQSGRQAISAVVAPLIRRGLLEGVLYLDSVQRPGAFSSEDMDLVQGVAIHCAAAIENIGLFKDIEGERQARERVSRYLSPSLVERVVKEGSDIDLGGEKAEITVLFADLRGFTPLAEVTPPDEVVVMLNEYFELAVDLIFKFGGTLDKFIGDAVMAFWGVPVRRSIDPHLTVMTAIKLQAELACLNERRDKLGKAPLGLGVGIHTGDAIAGNIGTPQRMDYTVIGDTVNLASRIQDLAPRGQIWISQATLDRMGTLPVVTKVDTDSVKGRKERVALYRVHGMYLQERVAHELRKVRRMQLSLRVGVVDADEDDLVSVGVLVDLSPKGAGILFEEALSYLFRVGDPLVLEILEKDLGFDGQIRGEVRAVRETFERRGTVYLHVGIQIDPDGGLPPEVHEFFFGSEFEPLPSS